MHFPSKLWLWQFLMVFNFIKLLSAAVNLSPYAVWAQNASTVAVAGTGGSPGTQAHHLSSPRGMFVDDNLTLYIADYNNHRIQMWKYGARNGTTVAGNGISGSSLSRLSTPSGVFVDSSDGYLYIVDTGNDRIVRWGPNATSGVCIAGCTNTSGTNSNQLYFPVDLAFDNEGSLYVCDNGNNRIQKFQILYNPIEITSTSQTTLQSTVITTQIQSTVQTSTVPATTEILTTTLGREHKIYVFINIDSISFTLLYPTTTVKPVVTSSTSIDITSQQPSTKMDVTSKGPSTQMDITSQPTSTMANIASQQPSTKMDVTSQGPPTTVDVTSKQPSTKTTTTSPESSTIGRVQTSQRTNHLATQSLLKTSQSISTAQSTVITTELPTSWTSKKETSRITSHIPKVTSTSTMTTLNCTHPIISLWPYNPSIAVPRSILRSHDFSISSTLQLHCRKSLAVIEQWIIDKCLDSSCTLKRPIQISSLQLTLAELFIPSKTLDYGTYQMTLIARMNAPIELISTAVTYIEIVSSPIQVQLIQFGPSMIILGQQQPLILNPGRFSIDPDQSHFNSTNWNYTYFYGIYNQVILPINMSFGNESAWNYGTNSSRSSLIVYPGSLSSNQTHHFRVQLTNIYNSSIISIGHLLVQVKDNISMTIIIKCTIPTMCISIGGYQMVNPTTQIGLTSFCIDNCNNFTSSISIEWNIYYGTINQTNNTVQWIKFQNKTQYINTLFFGMYSNNFTAIKDLLLIYSSIKYWRFEVIYTSESAKSIGLIDFLINSPPSNGNCSIYPLNGTITTLFTIDCFNWFDSDGIKDYSYYTWTTNRSNRLMLGYGSSSSFRVRMPMGHHHHSFSLQVTVRLHDSFDCITEFDLSPITVIPDLDNMNSLIQAITLSDSLNEITSNPIVHILYGGNQNDVCQILTSVSQLLNIFANENLQLAIQNNISAVRISIASLNENDSQFNNQSNISFNFTSFKHQLNTFASVQEYLMVFINNLTITTTDSILLQASALSQLTTTTNQLTRNALIIASTRCLQLSDVLLTNTERIRYEDLQTAAEYIAQCASNVLTAVNVLLYQRTIVLDLDINRANSFPTDYDTDLAFVWSNPNLFANGDDFSEETINYNRNLYYQKELANIIKKQFEETLSIITTALSIHQNIGQSNLMNTSSIIMTLKKLPSNSTLNQTIQLNDISHIQFPNNLYLNSTISIRCIQTPLSIAGDQIQSIMNLSNTLFITIFDENGEEIPINTSTTNKTIELFIPRDRNMIVPLMTLQNVTSLVDKLSLNNHQFNLHFINISQTNPNLSISIHFEIFPLNTSLGYMLIYKFDQIPQLNSSLIFIDDWSMLCPRNLNNDSTFTYFIDNQKSIGHESVIFGIRELNSTEFEMYCVNTSKNILINNRLLNFTSNYAVRIFTSGCYYLDSNNNWQSDGLTVGSLTDHFRTQCYSTHLSTFAGGFIVLPKPINWNYVFANADFVKNKTIYLTIIVVVVLLIILSVYARYLDNKDKQQFGTTILPNKQQNNQYFYQMVVFTGVRGHAGTTAKVHFILSGDDYETDPYTLMDSKRKILQRGSIDSFIFGVPKSLGLLNYLRIWHNNSGKHSSPSWFLKYIIVRDLQTMEKSYFICQQWLAVDKGDGKIERVLPVSNYQQMRTLVYSLSHKAYHRLSDDHLWFSIFSRPPATYFTRVQRCICCFVLLFTVMLLDILYYQHEEEKSHEPITNLFSIGPFHFTKQQIIIGIITDVLIFIPSTLLVTFFRRIQQRRSTNHISSVLDIISKSSTNQTFVGNIETTNFKDAHSKKKKKTRRFVFPWWCLFIAYGFSFVLIAISILLIIARGIEFGDVKIQKWLASLTIGFFSSVLLSQPVKVLSVAVFFVTINRCSKNEERPKDFIDENEEFYLNGGDDKDLQAIKNDASNTVETLPKVRHLSKTKVAKARTNRLREIQMWSSIRELFVFSCYLSILYAITYADRNPYSQAQVHHLKSFFLNLHSSTQSYVEILTVDDYWKWLEYSFVLNIRAQSWYNGDSPHHLTGFINDKVNRLIGWPVIRQLRIKSDSKCRVPNAIGKIVSKCIGEYSSSNEDHQSWHPGWNSMNDNQSSYSLSIRSAFRYQTNDHLDSYVLNGLWNRYDTGGYVYEFRGHLNEIQTNISKLRNLSWIDASTRVIIIQLTLYNPNVHLFTSITFLTEFLSTSGVFPQFHFQPIDLQDNQFQGISSIIQLIGRIIYMIFIIYFTYSEIRLFRKLKTKYFYSFWSLIQCCIIICSWIGLGIYIWRLYQISQLKEFLHQTNGYQYFNIQFIVYIDQILLFCLSFSCFFSTIRYLSLLHSNPRLSQFMNTLKYIRKDLFYFTWIFLIIYVAFISLFYLLFHSKISSCSDVFHTSEMLFEILLLKFDSQDLYQAESILGPLIFSLFIYFAVFICCTMMISIINSGFRHIRSIDRAKSNDNEDILLFLFKQIKHSLGFRRKSEIKLKESENLENKNVMDELADKIDELDMIIDKLQIVSSNALRTTRTCVNSDVYIEDIE
ncbi:hypothetical protein I4U23_015053 [Adineta vaga]|nr:hypothetical protein I4U23_015053 [Adineta vaga]